jgi:DNA polymerase-4
MIANERKLYRGGTMPRVILHSDLNSFFANAAILYHPEIRDKPVVVGSDESARAGVVLAANQLAKKKYRVKTGEALYAVHKRWATWVKASVNI